MIDYGDEPEPLILLVRLSNPTRTNNLPKHSVCEKIDLEPPDAGGQNMTRPERVSSREG